MRTALVVLMCLWGCQSAPAPQPSPQLRELDRQIAESGGNGVQAGFLLEKKAALLEQAGQLAAAAQTYEDAAAAHNRSPEGTNMPALRAEAARGKAAAIRGRIPK
jgi:hypothetical protein